MSREVEADFHDWEVLNNTDASGLDFPLVAPVVENSGHFERIEGDSDSESLIRADYFSLENQGRYAKAVSDCEEGSVESDNPSWIDPGSENRYARKNSGEFWSDSGSDRSCERKISEVDAKIESVLSDTVKSQVTENENLEILGPDESKATGFDPKSDMNFTARAKNQFHFKELDETQNRDKELGKLWYDLGGDELMKFEDVGKERDLVNGNDSSIGSEVEDESSVVKDEKLSGEEVKSVAKFDGEGKRRVAWWKVPFELLKYCVLRVNPVWSFSVAAAVMGFVILGRRLYRMKRMNQSLQLKVTVDDKKMSQFMSKAVRLNEAFSVVRRVPIVRPLLPAAGVNPWPAMSMR